MSIKFKSIFRNKLHPNDQHHAMVMTLMMMTIMMTIMMKLLTWIMLKLTCQLLPALLGINLSP